MKLLFRLTVIFFCILSLSLTYKTSQTLIGTWTLECITDLNTNVQDCLTEDRNYPITLQFTDDGHLGKINGFTTSNKVYGNYELYGENKIKVTQFGGTKVGEQGWGKGFWKTIRQSTSYEFKSDILLIYSEHDTKIMRFSR